MDVHDYCLGMDAVLWTHQAMIVSMVCAWMLGSPDSHEDHRYYVMA